MTELRLKFKTATGEEMSVVVDKERFAVGRHSENELSITDARLSRDHLRIERFGDVFVVTELGSSNGTTLNGETLTDPAALKDGDKLELGGLAVEVEIGSDEQSADPEPPENENKPTSNAAASHAAASSTGVGGLPTSFFYIAPLIGLVMLLIIGLIMFAFSGQKTPSDNSNVIYSSGRDNDPPKNRRESNTDLGNSTKTGTNDNSQNAATAANTGDTNSPPPATPSLSDTGKTDQNAAAFLRRIAQNDPKAFLTGEQAQKVNAKVKQLAGSSALVDNINSARKNASQITTIAKAKNLKPQFLAAAAIAKLGGNRGDVLQTAQGMAEVLDKLGTQIGNESADDGLLMIAAYDQGASGDFMKMRNMLQNLANKSPDSARAIRTIWFLQKNGKITDGEYEFALRFLAIGTIAQNPKDFGVNAEPLTF